MNDNELDAMLARGGRLSAPESDRVLDEVLRRTSRTGFRAWGPAATAVGLIAAAAAAWLVVAMRRPANDIRARGGASAERGVDVVCSGGSLEACPQGAHLVFRSHQPGYLTAYAEPLHGGERIWYFGADANALAVTPASVAERAVVVGPEHGAGPYAVHILVGSRRLTVPEVLGRPAIDAVVASEVVRVEVTP